MPYAPRYTDRIETAPSLRRNPDESPKETTFDTLKDRAEAILSRLRNTNDRLGDLHCRLHGPSPIQGVTGKDDAPASGKVGQLFDLLESIGVALEHTEGHVNDLAHLA